jgi:YVTN family beta-propeller protein
MYVTNLTGDTVSVISTSSNTVTATITVGDKPRAIAFNSGNDNIYVGNANDDTVSVISTSSNTVTATITVGDQPRAIAFDSSNNRMYVANVTDDTVYVIDTPPTASTASSNGGCGDNCIKPPTMGLDKSGERLVTDGFSYNGNAIDVEQFFTPYPLLTVDVGRENLAEFKIYDSSGVDSIRHFEVGFGARDIGQPFSLIEPRVEINLYPDEEIVGILIDPENILENVTVSNSVVSCDEQNNSQCLKLSISHTFRESLEYNILATNMWDKNRHSSANYFNHGIEITGESLNPPDTYTGHHYRSSYHLTETGDNTAVDEFGDSWTLNGKWIKDYIAIATDSDKITTILDRNHSEFYKIKSWTTDVAILKLLDICPTCMDESFEGFEESWSYEFPNRVDRVNDPKLKQAIFEQQVIAQKVMDQIMDNSR